MHSGISFFPTKDRFYNKACVFTAVLRLSVLLGGIKRVIKFPKSCNCSDNKLLNIICCASGAFTELFLILFSEIIPVSSSIWLCLSLSALRH